MTNTPVASKPAPAAGESLHLWQALDKTIKTRKPNEGALYPEPIDLWNAAVEYFEHVKNNPVEAPKLSTFEGQASVAIEPRPRMPTLAGLYAWLGISKRTWRRWCDPKANEHREDLAPVMSAIRDVMFDWKFSSAAAGTANANLIARDLGLGEKVSMDQTVEEKKHKDAIDDNRVANQMHPDATPEDLDKYYAAGKQPPLYSQEQLDAGAQFIPYADD